MKLRTLMRMACQPISSFILLIAVTAVQCSSDRPPAVIKPTSLSAYVGTCVEIKCKVTGYLLDEDALWFWMKDGTYDKSIGDFRGTVVYSNKPTERRISPQFARRANYTGSTRLANTATSSNSPSCSVSICGLTEEDSGKYLFRYISKVRDYKWSPRDKASLSVTENPCPITFNKPEPGQEGSNIRLTCSAPCRSYLKIESVPPSFKHLETSQGWNTYTATADFTASWTDDGREFTCQTRENNDPQLVKKISISVQYRPRNTNIESVGQTTEVAAGRSVTFKCNTDANPAPGTYSWFTPRSSYQSTSENSLQLRSVERADEGCYSCTATNRIGSGSRSTEVCIKVLYPPTDLTLSMDTEVTEGQIVFISCRVNSSPVSTLTLSRTSQGSTKELRKTTEINFLSYSFTATSAHSGQYTCSANNGVGSDSTQRSLRVKYGPQEVRVQADPGLIVKENMTLTLSCSAQSDPEVKSVSWSRITAGEKRHVHYGKVYTVKSVSENDSGLYSCTAHNSIGRGTSPPAEVQVKFGPKQAVVLRAEEEQGPDGSRSVTLSCSSRSFPVSLYTWYRNTDGKVTKVSENINYTVPSTQPGVYYCTAKNELGESTSEPVSLFQQVSLVKVIVLALGLLVIIFCVFLVYRLKRKNSTKEGRTSMSWSFSKGQQNTSRESTEDAQVRRSVPAAQQRAELTNGTCSSNALYSTVNFPKQDRPGTSNESSKDDSLYYASLNFDKTKRTVPPKAREDDVVYAAVKTKDQDTGDVYENFTKVQKEKCPNVSDSSDDEVEVTYSQVNHRSNARSRDDLRRSAEDEEHSEYSELALPSETTCNYNKK